VVLEPEEFANEPQAARVNAAATLTPTFKSVDFLVSCMLFLPCSLVAPSLTCGY
jgi:hypothetical protein